MSIKKQPCGTYRIRVIDKATGKKLCETFETKREAEARERELKQQMGRGEYIAPASVPTFREKSEKWFDSKSYLRDGSLQNLRGHLDNWLLRPFGNLRLDLIDTQMCETFRTKTLNETGFFNTQQIMQTMTQILEMAYRHNQVRSVVTYKLPKLKAKAVEFTGTDDDEAAEGNRKPVDPAKVLNPDEACRMLEHTTAGLARTSLTTIAATGIRDGEALALRWSEIDLVGATMTINRSLSWARVLPPRALDGTRPKQPPAKPRFWTPKTGTSLRTFPIPALVPMLREWKLRCPKGEADLVFPDENGEPVHRSFLLNYCLKPALKLAGLRHVTVHSLRHSFASALLMGNPTMGIAPAPVTEVQHLLGHSNPQITMRVYSHFFPTKQSGAATSYASAILTGAKGRQSRAA